MSPLGKRTPDPGEAPSGSAADESMMKASAERPSVLERVLSENRGTMDGGDILHEAVVAAWSGDRGTLTDGRMARQGASCLLRPAPGDRVLFWSGRDQGERWIVSILQRPDSSAPAVLATSGPLAVEASRIGIAAGVVHVAAKDFLTNTRNRHAIENTRTETARIRVADIGTDIRRAATATDDVRGTFMQQAGIWISSTVREARLKARAFMFD